MREIKFRLFHVPTKRMIDWLEAKEDYPLDLIFEPAPFYESMQYTGLKDKNGKEIYEGDIILDHNGDRRVVVWYEHAFWLKYPNGDLFWPNNDKRVLIGNIYENPELIK